MKGAIGREFEPEGAVGSTADAVGGPLDAEGQVGRQFKSDGAVGGSVEGAAEAVEEKGKQAVRHGERDKKAGKKKG